MLVKVFGYAVQGITATKITVEVNVSNGVNFHLVGLPDSAVKESQHRLHSALKQHGFKIVGRHITINMAPADIRKEGSAYDLPIAIGILAAGEQIPNETLHEYVIMGEVSLDGELRPIKGALPIAVKAKADGFKGLILPAMNAPEAAVVSGLDVLKANNLSEVIDFFSGKVVLEKAEVDLEKTFNDDNLFPEFDFADVKGQENIKRALEIAAAGGHNAILIGPPGAGKTMLSKRLPGILPPLSIEESLETTKIHSVAGKTGKAAEICQFVQGSTRLSRPGLNSPPHRLWRARKSICALQQINERADPQCFPLEAGSQGKTDEPTAIASSAYVALR